MRRVNLGCSLVLAGCLTLFAAASAPAQAGTRVPVTIVLVEEMPIPAATFAIQRRPDTSPADVILLPRSGASPQVLSEAIRALVLTRQNSGDWPRSAMTLRMHPRTDSGIPTRGVIGWTVQVLQDLRRADPLQIEGIGHVPAVQIWLPRQDAR